MPAATDTQTSPWGSSIPTGIVEDFIKTMLRHDALADFVQEYVFDALDTDGEPPAELGEALRVAFMEVIETSDSEQWDQVGRALVADARDCLEDPPGVASTAPTAAPPRAAARPAGAPRPRHWRYRQDGAQARARRETASRLIEAYEHLRRQNPEGRITLEQIVLRADISRETMFAQFGRTAGLRWAADAQTALELPALWCEVGLAEPGPPAERIKAVAREYLRLLLAYPGAMRTLIDPHELDELLRPKDPSRYRTLVEYRDALAHIVAEQDRLLEEAIGNAASSSGEIDVGAMTRTLTAAWLRIATHVWALETEPNAPRLLQKIAASTDAIVSELAPGSG